MKRSEAIKHFNGVKRLADALLIHRTAVYQWDEIPWIRQKQIEALTNGVLKADPVPLPEKTLEEQTP